MQCPDTVISGKGTGVAFGRLPEKGEEDSAGKLTRHEAKHRTTEQKDPRRGLQSIGAKL